MSRSSRYAILFVFAVSSLAACEAGVVDARDAARDTGTDRGPIVRDTGAPTDTGSVAMDVAIDEGPPPPMDSGGPADTGSPRDVPTSTDTGRVYCPTTCTTDVECQSMCPVPTAGYRYCCQYGPGGGSCSQRSSACDGSGTTAGTLGAACHMDSECNRAPANCCLTVGSAGTCGCLGSFGCQPASFCM